MSHPIFRHTESTPTTPLDSDIVLSCSHFEIPKAEGGVLVSVSNPPLMSGLCKSCWASVVAAATGYPQAQARAEQAEAELERMQRKLRLLVAFAWRWPGAEPVIDQMVELGLCGAEQRNDIVDGGKDNDANPRKR